MEGFLDKIISCCEKEIENQTYCIEKQQDLPELREARFKANFIKVMAILAKENNTDYIKISNEVIEQMKLDVSKNNKSTYNNLMNTVLDLNKKENIDILFD